MTTTVVLNAQSFGTGSNIGEGKFSAAPTTLQAGTTAYIVAIDVAVAAGQAFSKTTKVRVWYTTTTRTVAAADAVSKLGQTARYVEGVLDRPLLIVDGDLEPITGLNFHFWVDAPTLQVASTLTVSLTELP